MCLWFLWVFIESIEHAYISFHCRHGRIYCTVGYWFCVRKSLVHIRITELTSIYIFIYLYKKIPNTKWRAYCTVNSTMSAVHWNICMHYTFNEYSKKPQTHTYLLQIHQHVCLLIVTNRIWSLRRKHLIKLSL